jgi:hypothetical protein
MWDSMRSEVMFVLGVIGANVAQTIWERYFGRKIVRHDSTWGSN